MATKLYRVRSTKSDGTEIVWIAFRKDPPVRYSDLHSKIVEVDLPLAPDAEALSYTSGDRRLLKPSGVGDPFSNFEVRGYEVQHS
jgi:hypothetical protein